jgi:sulfite reductase beta subunit-like hemoprotein
MSMAAAIGVKGWCPGVLQPMQSGDGLIARVRPWCGAFTLTEAMGLADAAARFGNGHIDLTRRGNLQIRGVREEGLPGLRAALDTLDLLDRDPRTEAGRNIMVGPLAGLDPAEQIDVRPIAQTLVRLLGSEAGLHDLPSKFGFLVDGGGTVSIAGERADISLRAVGSEMAVGLDTPTGTQWLGTVPSAAAARTAVALASVFVSIAKDRQRFRDLPDEAFARLLLTPSPAGGGRSHVASLGGARILPSSGTSATVGSNTAQRSLATLGMTPFSSSMLRVGAHYRPQQNCHPERSEGPLQPPPNPYAIALPAGGGGPQGRRGTRSPNPKIARVMNTESPSALRAPPPAGEGALQRSLGVLDLGSGKFAVAVAAPFGRLEASQLRSLVELVRDSGAADIRLSPWRALYVEARDNPTALSIVQSARALGLVVDAGDPILRIEACPGAPACRSSSVDARGTARQIATYAFQGSIHVSGCAKGCARSAPADLVLVGEQGRYNVIRNGTTRDAAERTIGAEEVGALFDV